MTEVRFKLEIIMESFKVIMRLKSKWKYDELKKYSKQMNITIYKK